MLGPIPEYPPPGWIERGLDLLFPPMCVGCRRVGRWICPGCWQHIAWSHRAMCGMCGFPSAHNPCWDCAHRGSPLRTVVAVAPFEGAAREAVHALKYEGRHAIAPLMGRLMAAAARDLQVDAVTATPLHAARRRERGYDQARLLARSIRRAMHVNSDVDRLKRVRRTRQQVSLGPEERRDNVSGAFQVVRPLHGETVLLVDDVFTTGATMSAAAASLREGGAKTVYGVVFGYAEIGQDANNRKPERRAFNVLLPTRSIH